VRHPCIDIVNGFYIYSQRGASVADSVTYFNQTNNAVIDSLTTGYMWDLSEDRTLRFSISNGFSEEYFNDPAQMLDYVGSAIGTFAEYADIRFESLGYFDNPSVAYQAGSTINLSIDGSALLFESPDTWALGFFPSNYFLSRPYEGAAGDIFINLQSPANGLPSYEPGSEGYFLLLHEMGHALGLKHPHDDGGSGRPTFTQLGIERLDRDYISIMSYNDDARWNQIEWDPATPMVFDVLALQYMYGRNEQTRAGDTLYRLERTGMYRTLWDASGVDTVNVSGSGEGWYIELPSLTLSDEVDTKVGRAEPIADLNAAVPQDLIWLMGEFEHVTGSAHDDVLIGNHLDNVIEPVTGNDAIQGGEGVDVVQYRFRFADSTLDNVSTLEEPLSFNLISTYGTDSLEDVEYLQFTDVHVALDPLESAVGQAYRLYQSAFGRDPDSQGLGYWVSQLESGQTLQAVSYWFVNSDEFGERFGLEVSNTDYVNVLYQNILGRPAESEGQQYWVSKLDADLLTRAQALVYFSESPENRQSVDPEMLDGVVYTPWLG
jgi:hypothetical protein